MLASVVADHNVVGEMCQGPISGKMRWTGSESDTWSSDKGKKDMLALRFRLGQKVVNAIQIRRGGNEHEYNNAAEN